MSKNRTPTKSTKQLLDEMQTEEYSSASPSEGEDEEEIPKQSIMDKTTKKHVGWLRDFSQSNKNQSLRSEDSDDSDSSSEEEESTFEPLAKTTAKKQKVSSFFPERSNDEEETMKSLLSKMKQEDEEISSSSDSDDENDNNNFKTLIKRASKGQESDDDDGDIELGDLISSTQLSKDARVSSEKTQKELQNIEELKKIDKQYKKGAGMFYALEDTEIQGEERRAAFDVVDEGMEKWHGIVENVENARHVPLIYKHIRDKTEKEKILDKGITGSGVFDDVQEMEMNKTFEATKRQLANMDKETLLARHQEIMKKRKEMDKKIKKDKWLKNIKSKTYRKILKKQREKQEEIKEEEEMKNMDSEEIKQKILKKEREMITERLTMRHKNTSKWVKHAMKHQVHNSDIRSAVADQLKIHGDLLRKQTKKEDDNDSDEEDTIVEQMFKKDGTSNPFDVMRKTVNEDDEPEKKGLFGMKFMKKAEDRKKQDQLDLISQMEKDVNGQVGKAMSDEETNTGRRQFTKNTKNKKQVDSDASSGEEKDDIHSKFDNSSTLTLTKSTVKVSSNNLNKTSETTEPVQKETIVNSTKIEAKSFGSTSAPATTATVSKTSISMKRKRANSENPWLNKGGKTKSRDSEGADDALSKKKKKMSKDAASKILISTDESKLGITSKSTTDEEQPSNVTQTSKKNREQLEFEKKVKQEAFAGDDLELEFAEEKDKVIDEEINMPDLSTTFKPGWGSWAGFGREKQVKKDMEKKQRQIARITKKFREEKVGERADTDLNHVIIRETAKVPEKFLIPVANEVEAAIVDSAFAHPIGLEWNTVKGHRTQITPRVNLQSGQIVKALDYETMHIKTTKAGNNDPLLDAKRASKIESAKEQRYQKLKDQLKENYDGIKRKRQEAREELDKEKEANRKRYQARWEKDSDEE